MKRSLRHTFGTAQAAFGSLARLMLVAILVMAPLIASAGHSKAGAAARTAATITVTALAPAAEVVIDAHRPDAPDRHDADVKHGCVGEASHDGPGSDDSTGCCQAHCVFPAVVSPPILLVHAAPRTAVIPLLTTDGSGLDGAALIRPPRA